MTRTQEFCSGLACVPMAGQTICGDNARVWQLDNGNLLAALTDGLGHGHDAHKAALMCLDTINEYRNVSLQEVFQRCNERLALTRGAALSLALFDKELENVTYAGIGNITSTLVAKRTKQFLNTCGIVGQPPLTPPLLQSSDFHIGRDLLFMTTDGVSDNLNYTRYRPSLFPSLQTMAELVLLDGATRADDAGVVVVN